MGQDITNQVGEAPNAAHPLAGEEEGKRAACAWADRRIEILLRREGWLINHKRVRRLYNEMGLQLRNKSPKRRVKAKLREDRTAASEANQIWAMDFVHDELFDGRKNRILTIVDTYSRYAPAIDVRANYRGVDVVETLDRVAHEAGCLQTIRVDNGPEFISKELDLWAFLRGVTLDFSRPGKLTVKSRPTVTPPVKPYNALRSLENS